MTGNSRKMTVPRFQQRKGEGPPLVMLTAYDVPTTLAAEAAGVDAILVGDSLGNVLLGHESTLPVTMDEMALHARSVGRARKSALLVVDMPWLSYHIDPRESVRNAAQLVRVSGADAVKVEGGRKRVDAIRAIVDAEIPVMGHLGLTPQSVLQMGGYKVQGRAAAEAERIREDAEAIVEAGVFSMVLEGVPPKLAKQITGDVSVPTIGIGASPACDGQVLVYHDLLGMLPGPSPKFVRRYDESFDRHVKAIKRWSDDVRERSFPATDETYE